MNYLVDWLIDNLVLDNLVRIILVMILKQTVPLM